jgi:ATP-binding protein involved in chromosome partitioning
LIIQYYDKLSLIKYKKVLKMYDNIKERLQQVIYPGFSKNIVDFEFVKDISFDQDSINIKLDIPSASKEIANQLKEEIQKRLSFLGDYDINVDITQPKMPRITSSNGKNVLPDIQNFIMISSGKGGVGKSTTTVNLAISLAKQGKRVGLLDTDIYGPNIPRMMNIEGVEPIFIGNTIKPIEAHGIKVMSIGSLIQRGASLIWKGAMVTQAIEQMLEDIKWGELDVLIFDMPPGTGDAQLSLAQNLPVTAGVCVTTPQKVALDDTIRSMDMFKNLHIPIAGLIENMSGFICPSCGNEHDIFGKGTLEPLKNAFNTQILTQIPIDPTIREGGDSGIPISVLAPDCEISKRYDEAATKLWDFVLEVNKEGGVDNSMIQPQ